MLSVQTLCKAPARVRRCQPSTLAAFRDAFHMKRSHINICAVRMLCMPPTTIRSTGRKPRDFTNGKFRPAGDKLLQPQRSTSANCVPLHESTSCAQPEISSPTPPLHPCEPHTRSTWNRERFTWHLERFTWNARDYAPNHVSGLCGLHTDRGSARTSLTDEAQPHVLNRAQTACQST